MMIRFLFLQILHHVLIVTGNELVQPIFNRESAFISIQLLAYAVVALSTAFVFLAMRKQIEKEAVAS